MAYFGQKVIFSVSDVSERFKESISRFPANFKKISESRIFDLSRDPTSHGAKISLFPKHALIRSIWVAFVRY